MLKKSIKITIEIASIASILSMLTIAGLFIWVVLAPRTVFFIKPYLEKELSSINPKFKVKIDDSIIKWDRQQHSVGIYTSNVTILNDTNDTVATLPEISFGFSLMRFLRGHLLSSDLTIKQPIIYINTDSKTLYASPEIKSPIDSILSNAINSSLTGNDYSFKVHSIRVKDAKIFISTRNMDMLWKVDDGYAKLEREKGKRIIKSEFRINFGKDSTYFNINSSIVGDNSVSTEINFKDLPSYTISDIFPDYLTEQKMNMYFSGGSKLLFADKGALSEVTFTIDSAKGIMDLPEYFKKILNINDLKLSAKFYNNFSSLAIDNMELDLNGPKLKVSGNINNLGKWPDVIPSLDLSVETAELEAADIERYWPYNFGILEREWVTKNIKGGKVTSATGKFKFSSDDIKNIIERENSKEKPDTPPIPDDAIDANINIENTQVNYLPQYPSADNVKAAVRFTGHSMDASIESAKVLNSSLANGHVKFDNLWENELKITISGDFNGDAQNMINFLKLSHKEKPDSAEMQSIYNIKGLASGTLYLNIPIKPTLTYDDVDIKISSTFQNSVLPGLLNGKDVLAANLLFTLDKYDITAKGDVIVNSIPASIDLYKNFSDQTSNALALKVKGAFSPTDLKDLGAGEIPFVTGKMGLDLDINIDNNSSSISGSADLTQAAVKIENIGFEKLPAKNGKADFKIIKPAKEPIDIKDFKLQGDGFIINGNAIISADLSGISELSITSAKYGNSDFIASYKSTESSNSINVSGKGLDLSKAKISEWLKPDTGKIKKSLSLSITANKLYMKNGEVLHEFSSDLHCTAQICTNGNLYGKIRENNFVVLSLKNIGNRSALLAESDNAGAVINALNISQNINGGHLNIDSSLGKSNGITVARGAIKILDFTAVKTPLLGKILTLASFRGFEDLLNNEGIRFKKFEAPFTMANGIITVTKAKSSGASIGLTADGTIDTSHDEVDLKGVIVPAYAVNNILGKIPFVGQIIIGKENEGIIATKYSLKGPYDDAKVNVNPLSILAPGFVRNIFDIFD